MLHVNLLVHKSTTKPYGYFVGATPCFVMSSHLCNMYRKRYGLTWIMIFGDNTPMIFASNANHEWNLLVNHTARLIYVMYGYVNENRKLRFSLAAGWSAPNHINICLLWNWIQNTMHTCKIVCTQLSVILKSSICCYTRNKHVTWPITFHTWQSMYYERYSSYFPCYFESLMWNPSLYCPCYIRIEDGIPSEREYFLY